MILKRVNYIQIIFSDWRINRTECIKNLLGPVLNKKQF